MDPLSSRTSRLFKQNRLAGYHGYVRPGEVVPHFFSKGSYYLTRSADKLCAVQNSCLHRGAKLVSERRSTETISCTLHDWTYSTAGKLLSSPNFVCKKSCERDELSQVKLTEFTGLYFEDDSLGHLRLGGNRCCINSLNHLTRKVLPEHGIDNLQNGYVFDQENVTFYHVGWENFVEIYLDAYHLNNAHPGLGSFIDVNQLSWIFGDEWSLQVYPRSKPQADQPFSTSLNWDNFQREVERVGWNHEWGALLALIYPGLMLEFYPFTLVLSQLVPLSEKLTANYLQFYFNDAVSGDVDFKNSFISAYGETAGEDGVLLDKLEEGRAIPFYDHNHDLAHSRLEAGYQPLYEWTVRHS